MAEVTVLAGSLVDGLQRAAEILADLDRATAAPLGNKSVVTVAVWLADRDEFAEAIRILDPLGATRSERLVAATLSLPLPGGIRFSVSCWSAVLRDGARSSSPIVWPEPAPQPAAAEAAEEFDEGPFVKLCHGCKSPGWCSDPDAEAPCVEVQP